MKKFVLLSVVLSSIFAMEIFEKNINKEVIVPNINIDKNMIIKPKYQVKPIKKGNLNKEEIYQYGIYY